MLPPPLADRIGRAAARLLAPRKASAPPPAEAGPLFLLPDDAAPPQAPGPSPAPPPARRGGAGWLLP